MLEYNVHGGNIEVTDALKDYVQKRLGELEKYFEVSSDVIAHINSRVHPDHATKVEVTVPFPYLVLRAEDTTDGMCKSIGFTSEELKHQAREYKTRISRESRKKGLEDFFYEDLEEEKKTPKEFDIIRNRHLDLKSINAEEAVLQVDLLEHDFFAFENADTNGTDTVYCGDDGRYGLIETNEQLK